MQLFRGLLVSPSRPEHLPLGVPGRASVPIKHCFRVEHACAPAGSPAIQLVAADLKLLGDFALKAGLRQPLLAA
jgi:hypothetical protein